MRNFNDTGQELRAFHLRLIIAAGLVLFCFSLLLARFVWLQAIKYRHYSGMAEENRIAILPVPPERGWIKDRNGILLAENYSSFTLEITPSKTDQKLESLVDELATMVKISLHDRKRFKKRLAESKHFESVRLRSHLTEEEVARFSAQRYRFPGVEVQSRMLRRYPQGVSGEHAIGYVARLNQRDQEAIEHRGEENNYNGTRIIGKAGVEKSYESVLHGQTGYEEVEVSARGRAIRTLSHTPAKPGNNLILSIDIELQKVIEKAFGKQRGALIAIEPATGEVLAYVSMPTFNPNLFVEGVDQKSWHQLNNSLDRPMLNRPIGGTYPPGSTYKPFMALAALTMGLRTPHDKITDPGYFMLGKHQFRDQNRAGHGRVNLHKSIVESCDTYYYILANDIGVDAIRDFMKPWGFGQKTGIDLHYERAGVLPSTDWKKQYFNDPIQQKWYAGDTVSLGIGQGYNAFTPLQLARATATLANDGAALKPRIVKAIENGVTHQQSATSTEEHKLDLDPKHIAIVKRAMIGVTREEKGTAMTVFERAEYISAGKTGTAQVVGIKQDETYDAKTVAERKRDHSLYIAFAPADRPRIALAVIVENGGFGSAAAAPIAKVALDYYLLGKRPENFRTLPQPTVEQAIEPESVIEEGGEDMENLPDSPQNHLEG